MNTNDKPVNDTSSAVPAPGSSHYRTTARLLLIVLAVAALASAGYAMYALGMQRGMSHQSAADMASPLAQTTATTAVPQGIAQGEDATRRHISSGIKAGDIDPVAGRKVLYYHDPMVPGNKFDKPAKSPFMDMMLVPVYADAGNTDNSSVAVSPRIQQNLGLRSAEVVEAMRAPEVAAVGSIVWNERDQVIVQARASGFVEKLLVRATLDRVQAGQALAEIYVPEWIAAQEEFLSVRRMQGTDLAGLVDGARQRMRQVGMGEAQIAAVERSGQTQPRVAITAPIGGVVTELMVREGMAKYPRARPPCCARAPRWWRPRPPYRGSGSPAGYRPCCRTWTRRPGPSRHGWSWPTRADDWCRACSCRCSSRTCAVAVRWWYRPKPSSRPANARW
jgi:Cu(I)/Ag(I) efflux system membrane fusion protein